jgi:acetylornithine deacetylase/succinyl-diaminopimelate desuccinylase-like protein
MATAAIDLRLVKGNDVTRQINKLGKHIRTQGFYVIDRDPTDEERLKYPLIAKFTTRSGGYNAARTSMELPVSKAVVAAVRSTTSDKVVTLPSLGGSLPLSILEETLGAVTIAVPIANYDNNQHAENENIRLQNLWDGIETMAGLMAMKY